MLILLLLLIAVVVALMFPSVQTYVAGKVTQNLNEKYDTDINLGRLGLNRHGEVAIRDVFIADHRGDTLIYAAQLNTQIKDFKSLLNGQLFFDKLQLEKAQLRIKTHKGETQDNLSIFAGKFASDDSDPEAPPFILDTPRLVADRLEVSIVDENLEDPRILRLDARHLAAEAFRVEGSDISTRIREFAFTYNDELAVEQMVADFSYTAAGIGLKQLLIKTEKGTVIDADLELQTGPEGYSDFENQVIFQADFRESTLLADDLELFYNGLGRGQQLRFSTGFEGTLNDFRLTDLRLTNQGTTIAGDFGFANLLNPTRDYSITARRHNIHTNYYDLRRLMPRDLGQNLPEMLKELGTFTFVGTTQLYGDNIDVDGIVESEIGRVQANVAMDDFTRPERTTYKGSIQAERLHLGKLTGTTELGHLTAALQLDGKGLTTESIQSVVEGRVQSIHFNNYTYTQVNISGRLENPLFNGKLSIDDPNLKLEFDGLTDLSEDENQYDFDATIHYADLHKTNWVKRDSVALFTGRVQMDMKGSNIDDVSGFIKVSQATYQNLVDDYFFEDIVLTSSFEGDIRTLQVESPDITTGEISGRFTIEDLPNLFQNSLASIYANYVPKTVTTNQYVQFDFEIFSQIVEVFVPELQLGENTIIRGSVSSDESQFKLNFRTPQLTAFDNYIEGLSLQVDNNNPLFNTYIEIDSIGAGFYQVSDFSLINVTHRDTLFIRSEFRGGETKDDRFNLSLYHTINPMGKSVIGMKKSDIDFKHNRWTLNVENDTLHKVSFDNDFKDIYIDPFVMRHADEIITLGGFVRNPGHKDLKIDFIDVDLAKITPDIENLALAGTVNGRFDFVEREGQYYPESSVRIAGLDINDFPFGNLTLDIVGNEDLTLYDVLAELEYEGVRSLYAGGLIEASADPKMDLDVRFVDLNIAPLAPFGGEDFTNLRGFVSGRINAVGKLDSPQLFGTLNLKDAGMGLGILNVDMAFEDGTEIHFNKSRFQLPRTTVTDTKYNTKGTLRGYFDHVGFSDWKMDLKFDTQRFLVLDTEEKEDDLYYGTAFIAGDAAIHGPIDELTIDVNATTLKGTNFKIPISDAHSIGDDHFIHFLSPEEKHARLTGEEFVVEDIKGIALNFDLEITRDAQVEIVVDPKNNSSLLGRGEGTILMEITTLGRFSMYGDFQIYSAQYNFRFGSFIAKPFYVERGGNISWDGRPERARLDLKAVYKTNANPSVLLDSPANSQKVPVEAAIILSGTLTEPDFDYEVKFPTVSSSLKNELEFKLSEKEQREQQVLYLVATGSFAGDSFSSDQGTATLFEGVSSIVNDFLADEESKFKLDMSYQQGTRTPDMETADRVTFGFNTNITDRILFNGHVGVPVGGVSEAALAGNMEIQLLINQEGSLRLHFFNRDAPIQFIGESQGFEQGGGIMYSVDFDTFKELTHKIFKGRVTLDTVEETEETKLLDPFDELIFQNGE